LERQSVESGRRSCLLAGGWLKRDEFGLNRLGIPESAEF
jgi:hypothetical protein